MEELRELFGEESLSYDDFVAKITEKGIKLANIKAGGYVDKGKYDKLSAEFTKYKTDNDISKFADYDNMKAELETLKAEKADAELAKEVAAANVNEKFRKFVMAEVKPLVTKEKDFKTCLEEYLKENSQFLTPQNKTAVFQKSSQQNFENGENTEKTINEKMNKLFRGVKN